MDRITYLSDLYHQSLDILTKDKDEWMGLLAGMARFYQMSFDKNVLVYVQRPNAGLIATMKGWREETGRSIKRGAKSIAVLNMSQPRASLSYYFDITDTNGDYESLKKAMSLVWEVEEQYQSELLARFHEKYDVQSETMEEYLLKLVEKQVNEILPEQIKHFKVNDPSSMLYSLPEDAVKQEFIQLVQDSTGYVVLKKCGLSTKNIEQDSFANISHYNSLQLFMALGSYTLFLARPILKEIKEQIEAIKQERSRQYERKINENRAINSIDLSGGDRRVIVSQPTDISRRTIERSEEFRDDVERVHDRTSSAPPIRTDRRGQDQSDDYIRGRRSRGGEGEADTRITESTADAGNRGYTRESSPYKHDNQHSGGDSNKRSDIENQIVPNDDSIEHPNEIEPSADVEKPSADGFFVVPSRNESKAEGEQDSIAESQSEVMQKDHIQNHTDDSMENIAPEITENHNMPEASLVIEDIVDTFLCSDEMILDKRTSIYDISSFFVSGRRQEQKETLIKFTYESLDMEYLIDNETTLLLIGSEEGITFSGEKFTFFITYRELTERIDYLILTGIYPHSNEDEVLDEYAIPDEAAEMRKESNRKNVIHKLPEAEDYQQYSFYEEFADQDIYPPKEEAANKEALISKVNYRFSPKHNLYEGGAKTKCKNNIAAIQLLKKLQDEMRPADSEEQIILAKYVGWGGLANALTPNKSGWEEEYTQIKALLSEEEFESAQESTTTAYYTEQEVIQCMYQALERFGFREGNILDPAMGNGNFFSVLPESMNNSKLYGVEIDTITGQIARLLYPNADIEIRGYEDTGYPDQFFDVAVGNIPFNSLSINDSRYNKYNFKIHDYFIAKTLDKVRTGGIIAFITTKGTMDKSNPSIRRYMAGKAELIGAIRLPNTAFQAVAGTKATADIIFLKKRERDISPTIESSPWISVEENEEGIPINRYFIDHPEMVLGRMVFDEGMYANAKTTACVPNDGENFIEQLNTVIHYLDAAYEESTSEFEEETENKADSIKADPSVKNFSYTLIDGEIYYREHSKMYRQDITGKKAERIKGMIGIHDSVRTIIDFQTDKYNREYLSPVLYEQKMQVLIQDLNHVYDKFVSQYGYLNSYANIIAFSKDGAAPLVRSIEEEVKEQKDEYKKSAIFYKPTIHQYSLPKKAENAEEALKISLNSKGKVDLVYMSQIYEKSDQINATEDEIILELGDRIYQNPAEYFSNPYTGWVVAEEYLSGYVKDKLTEAMLKAEQEPERFTKNVEALKLVQPEPLKPDEISFTIGSTWIPAEIYQQFMYDTFKTLNYHKSGYGAIALEFSKYSGAYFISSKGTENNSITVSKTYRTGRINAYEILENSLNLKTVEVRDRVEYKDENGDEKVKYVLNKAETILAREKQAEIKLSFESWLFAEPERSARLTTLYNDLFNNIRPRVYNGDDLVLPDISQEIILRKHQKDVIAHAIYGNGNLGIFHEVGAGKTFSAIAAAYELKRLNIINKPLFPVPNHLVGQWAREYLRLYPNANILVAEKKDFEKKNRRRFVSRIASGDYHAIIMAQSSFELIGLSRERQLSALKDELDAITNAIKEEKKKSDKGWSLKQMMIFCSNLQNRYDLLFKADKKDDVITFEELGVDALIVDEAHAYKNNFSYIKMRGVAGVGSSSSQRAMDMHMKCQFINELNQGKGVIYLTGTPIANSMSELFVLQKTLQPKDLQARGLLMFDSWASTFGKVESSLEIKPEGNGYQMKSRFARFHNLPELMSMVSMIADIKTADMLDLPVPKLRTGGVQVVKTKITPEQKAIIVEHGERAEKIRAGVVDSSEDNFLKLTMEARLLAVDPRILDPSIPDDPDTKLNVCGRKVAEIYHETADKKSSQIVFCDQGTPKADGSFNFYDTLKEILIKQGVKLEEAAFIHEAKSDVQKEQLYEKVRNGKIRVLIGSTARMGTGMNCQNKLTALHHLDIPWRPSDLIQRNGRILRQGNENEEVSIFNYITEETFDGYLWQILEQKQRYISQIMTGRSSLRSCEDIDDTVLQYAEFKALAISDERIKEKMEVDNEIQRLQILKSSWKSGQNDLQYKIAQEYPAGIKTAASKIVNLTADLEVYQENKTKEFSMKLGDIAHTERSKAAEHFKVLSRRLGQEMDSSLEIGSYAGFTVSLKRSLLQEIRLCLRGNGVYYTDIGESELGAIMRMEHLADHIPEMLHEEERKLEGLKAQMEEAKQEISRPFSSEERLNLLLRKKVELDLALEFKEDVAESSKADMELTSKPEERTKKKEDEVIKAEHSLFRLLYPIARPIFDGNAYYMKYQAEGFDDLVLETVGDGEYSIAHYYEQNGDLMRDPEITFSLDKENQCLHPTSYQQDNLGVFYETSEVSRKEVEGLEDFMHTWFQNINSQGFELHKIEYYENELSVEEEEEGECMR